MRTAVPKVCSLTIVITPARSRSSSACSRTAAGGAVGEGVETGVGPEWDDASFCAVGIRIASAPRTNAMTSAMWSWSFRNPGIGPTVLQRSWTLAISLPPWGRAGWGFVYIHHDAAAEHRNELAPAARAPSPAPGDLCMRHHA